LGPGFHTGGFTVAFGHGHPLVLVGKTNQGIKKFNFSKLIQFSDVVVLAYMIIVGFQIWFSQPIYYIFHKLIFNQVINNLLSLLIKIFFT